MPIKINSSSPTSSLVSSPSPIRISPHSLSSLSSPSSLRISPSSFNSLTPPRAPKSLSPLRISLHSPLSSLRTFPIPPNTPLTPESLPQVSLKSHEKPKKESDQLSIYTKNIQQIFNEIETVDPRNMSTSQLLGTTDALLDVLDAEKIMATLIEWNQAGDNREIAMERILQFLQDPEATELDLQNCSLDSLPDIFQFKTFSNRLQVLDLSRNQLTVLPGSIGYLKTLQKLRISYNQLETLPESCGKLQALQTLDLAGNKLQALPISISVLRKLTKLYLSYNSLTRIPLWVRELPLQTLDLAGNKPLADNQEKKEKTHSGLVNTLKEKMKNLQLHLPKNGSSIHKLPQTGVVQIKKGSRNKCAISCREGTRIASSTGTLVLKNR